MLSSHRLVTRSRNWKSTASKAVSASRMRPLVVSLVTSVNASTSPLVSMVSSQQPYLLSQSALAGSRQSSPEGTTLEHACCRKTTRCSLVKSGASIGCEASERL